MASKTTPKVIPAQRTNASVPCQLIVGTVQERAFSAEQKSRNFQSARCTEHNLFHNWEELLGEDKRTSWSNRLSVRFDGYYEISPGRWLLKDARKPKKQSRNGDDE